MWYDLFLVLETTVKINDGWNNVNINKHIMKSIGVTVEKQCCGNITIKLKQAHVSSRADPWFTFLQMLFLGSSKAVQTQDTNR